MKGARENCDFTPNSQARSHNMVNRAQLTPIKNDSLERIKPMNSYTEDRNRKLDRLDPIQHTDSHKYLWLYYLLYIIIILSGMLRSEEKEKESAKEIDEL